MNKELRVRALSEGIGAINDCILREATEARAVRPKRRWALVAASLAVILCLGMIPLGLGGLHTVPDVDVPDWVLASLGEQTDIDDLHKLHYYGALSAATSDTPTSLRLPAVPRRLLASTLPVGRTAGTTDRYAVDPNEIFQITRTIAFQIEVEDGSGFLASQLGGGVINVVVSENSLETMITFRHGDRYYSCLLNGISEDEGGYSAVDGSYVERDAVRYHFSTHKYIDGFDIVKNTNQLNFSFYFWMDRKSAQVVDFRCFHSGDGDAWDIGAPTPDTVTVIPNTSMVSGLEASFTLRDLQTRFGS